MGDKSPITLFTDQDAAMAREIKKAFPTTRHRLCLWHLMQNANAVTRFGVLKSDATFKAAFNKCLSGCLNEVEFNACWEAMVTKYNLKEHKWFIRMYKLRYKWATALSMDFFSAGILSSQRSESSNNAVGFRPTKKTSLTEFYHIFQETIKRWRRTEDIDEFNTTKSIPTSHYPMTSLLKHAAQVYTHSLFRDFEEEFNLVVASQVQLIHTNGLKMIYRVYLEDRAGSAQSVMYDPPSEIIICPCKNFEESGWLCFHCIRVLHLHSVQKIPEKYISFRWTKFAKVEVWNKHEAQLKAKGLLNSFTPWRLHMLRKYYSLILKSHTIEEARKILEESFKKDSGAIQTIVTAASNNEQNTTNTTTENENFVQVLDPAHANTKGKSKKRIPWSYDNFNKGKRRKHREFGSKTPKHLFLFLSLYSILVIQFCNFVSILVTILSMKVTMTGGMTTCCFLVIDPIFMLCKADFTTIV
ncbi:protein FAR-RED IMPAIRED RESPONSE 1-like [Spinacia oleracea]|uniref:Protein FAR1-RELATED SEQUENCE n=1 Tax=Spinacia oleracea TaxID=3562 RepID=A0A9R0ILN6_SPIOL|nr:protein FAR-RED IMPAIRED RESPONSE 1-like [Spinacia oleracea]